MQKKIISMILAIAMVITMFAGIAMTTSAAEAGDVFTKITSLSELTDGEYLVVGATLTGNYTDKLGTMASTGNAFMAYETPEIVNDQITFDGETITAASVWTITKTGNGYTIADKDGKYLNNAEDAKNTARTDEDAEELIITAASPSEAMDGTFAISRASGTYIYLNWNYNSGNSRFAFYKAENNTGAMCSYLTLYKFGEGAAAECDHADAVSKVTAESTCVEAGIETWTCACGETWTEEMPLIDHDYDNGICTMCGDKLSTGEGTVFTKITSLSQLTDGEYLVVGATTTGNYTDKAGTMINTGNTFMGYETPEIVGNTITVDGEAVTAGSIWTIAKTATGYTIQDKDGKYLNNVEDTKNVARADEDYEALVIASGAETVDGSFTISRASGTYIYLNWNYNSGNSRFAFYGAQNNTAAMCAYLTLYKSGGTTEVECDHADAVSNVTTAATCTKEGVLTWTCACGETWTEEMPLIDHDYDNGICTMCGDELPAVGASEYNLITVDNIPAGNYIIASTKKSTYETLYFATANVSGYWTVSDTAISAKNDIVTSAQLPADAQVFTFAGNNTDGFAISCTIDGAKLYLGYSDENANNTLALSADYANIRWNVIEDAEGGFALSAPTANGAYVISDNSTAATSIRGYASGKVYVGLYLFVEKAEDGACMHGKTEIRNAIAATCTANGYSGDTYCALCNKKLSSGKTVTAIGHKFDDGICSNCGANENTSYGLISEISAGNYIIASTRKSTYDTLYPATANISGYWTVSDTAITAKNDIITSNQLPADAQVFTFTGNNTDGFAISCLIGGVKQYLGYTDAATNNTLALGAEYSKIRWTVIEDAEGGFALSTPTESGAYVLSDNSTAATSIRAYASGKVYNGIYLFKEGYEPGNEDAPATPDQSLTFNMAVTVGAEMSVGYSFMAAPLSKYESFYLEVTKAVAGGDPIVTVYNVEDFDVIKNPTTGEAVMYKITYKGINAKEMGDEFTTTLYAVDAEGKTYCGPTKASSIKTALLEKMSAANASSELKTMAIDMLNYGAAAQVRLNYNVENLVNADLTEEQKALGTQEVPDAEDKAGTDGEGIAINAAITVGSKVELGVSMLYTAPAGANVKCVITDEGGKVLATLDTEAKYNVSFSAKYGEVGAREMRKVIKVAFFDGETQVSQTMSWSVESYVAQTRAKTGVTEAEVNMVNAMLAYGDAVAAYLNATGQ